jgi:AcrR family transcriptional regulator
MTAPRATRRSGAQVRAAVLAAAAREFARVGYSGARLKEIASLAGTSESGLARHFASKEELFAAAVLGPFQGLLAEYRTSFAEMIDHPEPDRGLIEVFMSQLFAQVDTHRDSVLALILAGNDPDAEPAVSAAAGELLGLFSSAYGLTKVLYARTGQDLSDSARLWPGLATGMIVAATVFERFFLPAGDARPDREELLRTMTDVWLHGIMGEPPSGRHAPRASIRRPGRPPA